MAKLTGPAHSFDASGRLGGMVFIKGGYLRRHVDPANPRSPAQQNNRQNITAAGSVVHVTNAATRDQLKQSAALLGNQPAGQWPGLFGRELTSRIPAARTAYAALSSTTDWETQGVNAGFQNIQLPNATDPALSPGLQMFLAARTLYQLGIHPANGDPDESNAAAWATAITG